MAELHADLTEAGYFAEPEQPDLHPERIDTYLGTLDEADAADVAWQERLIELGNLAFVVTNYDLQTGDLIP